MMAFDLHIECLVALKKVQIIQRYLNQRSLYVQDSRNLAKQDAIFGPCCPENHASDIILVRETRVCKDCFSMFAILIFDLLKGLERSLVVFRAKLV